jgi:hypothetical protein
MSMNIAEIRLRIHPQHNMMLDNDLSGKDASLLDSIVRSHSSALGNDRKGQAIGDGNPLLSQ